MAPCNRGLAMQPKTAPLECFWSSSGLMPGVARSPEGALTGELRTGTLAVWGKS